MISTDVVVAGGGVAGLLIASALASKCSVVLLEQHDSVPRNKYWLTDAQAARDNPQLQSCVDRHYDFMDFVAYDGLRATVNGDYSLWDTEKLIGKLEQDLNDAGATVLTGHTLYTFSQTREAIVVRANSLEIKAKLLIDCMGFGSPIVGAKSIATIKGYYIVHGCEVLVKGDVRPIGLDNVVINKYPAFFELFPTSRGTAHAAIILPSHQYKPSRSIKSELMFILRNSHYASQIALDSTQVPKSYFGIVPVGRLRTPALDRILFFGEAGQANPATTATALTRMLFVCRPLAASILDCLEHDKLGKSDLLNSIPRYMTPMNRLFQEMLFDSILSFNSDDFRRLVEDLRHYPADVVNDLIFAKFKFGKTRNLRLTIDALLRPNGVLGRHVLKSFLQRFRS
ncbi:MAG TPA: lycopene cyclase family protein [Pyrinomonadaceae bacterium]|nr:lycopene cyclase family protein [Pyrinomonadaceae bacterium]